MQDNGTNYKHAMASIVQAVKSLELAEAFFGLDGARAREIRRTQWAIEDMKELHDTIVKLNEI